MKFRTLGLPLLAWILNGCSTTPLATPAPSQAITSGAPPTAAIATPPAATATALPAIAPSTSALPPPIPAITPATPPPINPAVLSLLASAAAAAEAGKLDMAIDSAERAIRIQPESPRPWSLLAAVRLRQGKHDQALQMAIKSNTLAQEPTLRQTNDRIISAAKAGLAAEGKRD